MIYHVRQGLVIEILSYLSILLLSRERDRYETVYTYQYYYHNVYFVKFKRTEPPWLQGDPDTTAGNFVPSDKRYKTLDAAVEKRDTEYDMQPAINNYLQENKYELVQAYYHTYVATKSNEIIGSSTNKVAWNNAKYQGARAYYKRKEGSRYCK